MSADTSKQVHIPLWQFAARLTWVVVQLMLVYWLGESGAQFFYQGF